MVFFLTDYYKRPGLPLLAAYVAGLVIGRYVSPPLVTLAGCALLCLLWIIRALLLKQTLRLVPILLFAVLGILAMDLLLHRGTRSDRPLYYADKGLLQMVGQVVTTPEKDRGRQKCLIELEGIGLPNGEMASVSGRIRLTVAGDHPDLTTGDRLIIESRLKPFRNFYNPGGFDYERYMAAQDTWASCYARADQVRVLIVGSPGVMERFRQSFESFIDREVASSASRQVLKALLVGNRKALDPAMQEAFNRTGTAHLLAISGLHVGIVAGLAFGLGYLIFSRIPGVLWEARARRYAGLLALAPVLAYGILSGMAPSTQRAVLMVAVLLLTHSLDAEHDVLNSLALAALSILIVSPGSLFGASFQLSFAAVFFIVWGMACVAKGVGPDERDRPRSGKITAYVMVSLLACVGTLPLVAAYFNRVSLIGPVANLALVPLVAFLVVPLGLAALFVYPLSSLMAMPFIRLAGMVLDPVLSLIQTLSALPYTSVRVVGLSIVEIACCYGLLMAGLLLVRAKRNKRKGLEKKAWGMIVVLVLITAGDVAYWVYRRHFNDDLRVTVLDVGQGSANLVELPGGSCMLIDGGGFADHSSFDMGEKVLAPFLWSRKINTVDRVVLSHPESDHMNGLLFILDHFSVKEFWFNGPWRPTKSCGRMKEIVERRGIPLRTVEDISETVDLSGVTLRVLWPELSGFDSGNRLDTNDGSLVVRMDYQGIRILFPGDISEKVEQAMVHQHGDDLASRILVVPHHGSKTSTSETFLDAVAPEYALIPVGYRNRFAMPHQAVLARLEKRNLTVYRTDHHGAIALTVKKGALKVTPFLAEPSQNEPM